MDVSLLIRVSYDGQIWARAIVRLIGDGVRMPAGWLSRRVFGARGLRTSGSAGLLAAVSDLEYNAALWIEGRGEFWP